MKEKKIITVFGATGAQGGSVVRAILNDKNSEFTPRAVTREPNSEKALELKNLGAEVVHGDLDNPDSIDRVFEGAYGAYCVTFFWHHFSPEKEMAEAKIMAEAAKRNGLKHVIWSTLEDTREFVPLNSNQMPTLQGKYKVPHFDGKAESDKYFRESGVPVTYLYASFYWENFIYFGTGPKKVADNKYAIILPMGNAKLAGIASEDIGKCAYSIFKNSGEMAGKRIGIASDHLTVKEIAEKMSRAMDVDIVYQDIEPETFRSFGFPGADDVGNMFQFYRDFEEEGLKLRDINRTRQLNPDLMDFDSWLSLNASRIPLEDTKAQSEDE